MFLSYIKKFQQRIKTWRSPEVKEESDLFPRQESTQDLISLMSPDISSFLFLSIAIQEVAIGHFGAPPKASEVHLQILEESLQFYLKSLATEQQNLRCAILMAHKNAVLSLVNNDKPFKNKYNGAVQLYETECRLAGEKYQKKVNCLQNALAVVLEKSGNNLVDILEMKTKKKRQERGILMYT